MPYRNGTLVTQYQENDEYTGSGERTCSGYELDVSKELDPSDVCIGMVLSVVERGIRVRWVEMCQRHMEDHSMLGWYQNGELWEIGQIA
jgi:hypothetical protein